MRFDAISQSVTITFDMDTLEALARICRVAVNAYEEEPLADAYLGIFTMATMIARTHGEFNESEIANMERIRARLATGAA